MKVTKSNYMGREWIGLQFNYDKEIVKLIKQIKDATWDNTFKTWYIPFTVEAYESLIKLFPEVAGSISEFPKTTIIEAKEKVSQLPVVKKDVNIEVVGRKIFLSLPKNDDDIRFILSMRYSRWESKNRQWIVPNYQDNLDIIRERFDLRINRLLVHDNTSINIKGVEREIGRNELLIIRTLTGRLKLFFGFDNEISSLLKSFVFHHWDATNKWWTVPYSEKYLSEINELAIAKGMKVTFEEEPKGDKGI